MKSVNPLVLCCCLAGASGFVVAAPVEVATIINSGSTNFTGWNLTIRSDGSGSVVPSGRGIAAQGATVRPFSVPIELAQKFFRDVRAARDANIAGTACMKSVSFGTRLNVIWHSWTSPDLSCPVTSWLGATLRDDVSKITAIVKPPTGSHRIFLPVEPRRVPSLPPMRGAAGPSAQPLPYR